ncbi:MAG TPA: cytochrome d ubiquinol oxidase subunit II [Usitatibacter sp.]|jgi:cytochrome d ubiquinol oxidase subunit II|nr:cytochrome d ubiquinol oxidase subunit II [Usitatibacter sp.]
MIDYETLKLIWWLLVGVLLVGFAVTGGFDMGVGTLLPFLGRSDEERRVVINSIGATWEGNQVWLITAGGAMFAAWPLAYAAAFSGFYVALLLTLFALFLRPVGFDFRGKVEDPRWRAAWDWGLFVGGAVPALIFGVAFGNLLQGVPFHFDTGTMAVTYTGSFWALLNPFALLAGLVSVAMLVMHGAAYLQARTDGVIEARARRAARWAAIALVVTFALAGVWITLGINGYRIVAMPPPGSAFVPTAKTVESATGLWIANFVAHPWLCLAPAFTFAGALGVIWLSGRGRPWAAFAASGAAVAGVIFTAGFAMFPFIMPSSSDLRSGLTAWDAVSSRRTLSIMFWVVVFMLPVVLAYTTWVYWKLRGKITVLHIRENTHTSY